MTLNLRRTLLASGVAGDRELDSLLQAIWAAESLRPSSRLEIVADGIVDCVALDNRSGRFGGIDPSWEDREVRLSDVWLRMLRHGAQIHLTTESVAVVTRLRAKAADSGITSERLHHGRPSEAPRWGVFGDGYRLSGRIRWEIEGPRFVGSAVTFEVEASAPVAELSPEVSG
jgi:hypothetical protein